MRNILKLAVLGLAAVIGLWIMSKPRPKPKPNPIVVNYPISGMYSNMRSFGDPFVINGVIDSVACREQAKFDVFIIDPDKRDNLNKQALAYIRSLNPKAKILAYVPAGGFYVCGPGWYGQVPPDYGCDTTTFQYAVYQTAKSHNAILFDKAGKPIGAATGIAVDFAAPGFAAALAATAAEWVAGSGANVMNGAFNDGPCTSIAGWWPGNQTDYERAGYHSLASWDSAYSAGVDEYYASLRYQLGPGLVVGNCGPYGPVTANGWTGENHPLQNPGTWATWDDVLDNADTAYTAPQLSFITAPRSRWQTHDGVWHVSPFSDPEVQRQFRFVTGSASLHDHAVGVVVGSPFDPLKGFMPDQWSDWYHSFGTPKGKAEGSRREFSNGTLIVNSTPRAIRSLVGEVWIIVPPMDAAFIRTEPLVQ